MKHLATWIVIATVVSPLAAQLRITVGTDARIGLEVTIYSGNLALVKDSRTFTLAKDGRVEVLLENVAARIRAETVLPESQTPQRKWAVLEQNYEYDLLTPKTLLAKYVGKRVRLVTYDSDNKVVDRQSATLLSVNEGPLYRVGKEIHLRHPGHVILPEVPEELVARPSLWWLVEGEKGEHTVQVSYLTGGLSWRADYVLKVNPAASEGDLTGWITIHNESSSAYPDATVKLVAGDVHRAQPEFRRPGPWARAMQRTEVAEETFLEYHLYTIPWKTTLLENRQKQVELLSRSDIGLKKRYSVEVQRNLMAIRGGDERRAPVKVGLSFFNSSDNSPGEPFPGGIVRIYSEDRSGALQFAGEDRIGHTPRDEKVEVTLGNAFDLVCWLKQTEYELLARKPPRRHRAGVEVTLRNRKVDEEVTIQVYARFGGQWEIRSSSHDYVTEDAFTARFPVEVPAGEEVTLKYQVAVTQ